MPYLFKGGVSEIVKSAINEHDSDPTIGDMDIDKTSVYFEVGSGNNGILFDINQITGKIEVQLFDPNSEKNEWAGEFAEGLKKSLQSLVIQSSNGGRRKHKTHKNRKTRKLKRKL